MLNQTALMKIAKSVNDENEMNFNILRRRLSETSRQCNAVTRQNISLQKDIKSIKQAVKKIKKLASSEIDYRQEIIETCDNILK